MLLQAKKKWTGESLGVDCHSLKLSESLLTQYDLVGVLVVRWVFTLEHWWAPRVQCDGDATASQLIDIVLPNCTPVHSDGVFTGTNVPMLERQQVFLLDSLKDWVKSGSTVVCVVRCHVLCMSTLIGCHCTVCVAGMQVSNGSSNILLGRGTRKNRHPDCFQESSIIIFRLYY